MEMPKRHGSSDSYRFGFNGMEKDDETYVESGAAYDFGARIYSSRLGRWLALDPLMKKYPSISPYAYVANNPIYWLDKEGKELWIGGDREKAESDVRSIVPEKYRSRITITDDNEVKFDMEGITIPEYDSDPGLKILSQMTRSDKKYLYEVVETATVKDRKTETEYQIDLHNNHTGIENSSVTERMEYGPKGSVPKDDYDGQVSTLPERTIYEKDSNGSFTDANGNNYSVKPRSDTVLHELIESYERTDNGKPYMYQDPNDPSKEDPARTGQGAHGTSIKRAKQGNPDPKIVGKTPGEGVYNKGGK